MNDVVPVAAHGGVAGSTGTRAQRKWIDAVLLLAILSIALWLRLTHLDSGLSFDEHWHLASTQGIGDAMTYFRHNVVYPDAFSMTGLDHKRGLWSVWTGMDGILHPPLFIVALRLWREIMGTSDLAAHGFSVFCGLVSITFTFLSAKLAMNRVAGALAALALAFAQTQVYFSQEVRAYAMLIAIGSIALWLMTRIELLGPTRQRVVALALLTLPLLLTHYFSFGACLAIGIYGLWSAGPHRKAFLAAIVAAAAIYAVVWIPFAVRQLDDLGTGDVFLKSDTGVLHVLLLTAGTPFRLLAERDYQIERTPLLSAVLFVLPWLLVRRQRALLPWSMWLCASVATIVLLDLTRTTVHTAYIRYLAIATPPITLLFIGTVWALGRHRMAYAVGGMLCFAGAIYLFSGTRVLLDADDLNDATRIVERQYQKGDAIVTHSGVLPSFYADALALTLSHSPKIFPTTLLIADRPLTPELIQQLGTRSVWLVSGELRVPAEEFIPGGRVLSDQAGTPTVRVRHILIETSATTRPAN